MSYELRPLSLAELLDRTFSLYRRYFWVFVGIMALPSLAMLTVSVGIQLLDGMATLPDDQQPTPEVAAALVVGIVIGGGVAVLFYWITYALALGATTAAVSEIYAERVPSIAAAYRATRGRIGRLAWLMFLVTLRVFGVVLLAAAIGAVIAIPAALLTPILSGLVVLVAMFFGFALCAWMFLRYAVAVPAAVLEDRPAAESIRRSIHLTGGSLLRVVVLFVFTVIVTYAVLMIFQMPFAIAAVVAGPETPAGFWLNMLGVVTGAIASALTGPLAVVAMAVLYYDLRIRKEGLDLDLMVAALRQVPSPSVPDPSSSPALPS